MQEFEFQVMENGSVTIPASFTADDEAVSFVEVAESKHPWEDDETAYEFER